MRSALLAVLCFTPAFTIASADVVKKETLAEVRSKYAKKSGDALKIAEPAKITKPFAWKDGGTIGIELTDAKDQKHLFALYPERLLEPDKKPILNLFVGVTNPRNAGAKMVDIRGPEESALYGVLLRAIEKHPERDVLLNKNIDDKLWEKRKLWATDLLYVHTFFHRLEWHFYGSSHKICNMLGLTRC